MSDGVAVTPALTTAAVTKLGLPDAAEAIGNRRWVRRRRPFPHLVAQDVFAAPFAAALDRHFRGLLADRPELFERSLKSYDAGACNIENIRDGGPLEFFLSRSWHDLLQRLLGVEATGDVVATLHHHEPGSRRGWPHNDLAPGYFGGPPPAPHEIRTEADSSVNYRDGSSPDGAPVRSTVRAVSVLYYLANGPWSPGDGGETGLFTSATDAEPALVVPPVDNSIVVFECTPNSMHAFLGARRPRNCMVMWVHQPMEHVVQRWGAHSIVHW